MQIANFKSFVMMLTVIGLVGASIHLGSADACGDCRNDPACKHDVRGELFVIVTDLTIGNACQGSVIPPCGSCSNDPTCQIDAAGSPPSQ